MVDPQAVPPRCGDDDQTVDAAAVVTILRRRAWLVLGLPALALVSVLFRATPPTAYEARLRVAVDIPRSLIVAGSDEGTAAKIGEALIDDVARIIPSQAFAEAVAGRLPAGVTVAPGQIASDLSATDRHRVADIWVRGSAPAGASVAEVTRLAAGLQAVADAAVAELEQNGQAWFARLGEDNVALTVVDRPSVARVRPSLRERLDAPLFVGLALVVGVGLAFLMHAVDPRLHDALEAEAATGALVVARIPGRRRWRR